MKTKILILVGMLACLIFGYSAGQTSLKGDIRDCITKDKTLAGNGKYCIRNLIN